VSFGRHRLAGLGRHAYTVASLFVRPRGNGVRVAASSESALHAGSATGVVINNTAHLANFRPFRGASFDDGRLDLMVLERGWWGQVCHNVAVLAGSSSFAPRLMRQAPFARVDLDHPQVLMIDGELLRDVISVEAACVPSALRCLAGR
jgi:diacylglycerol kinase family enzyme